MSDAALEFAEALGRKDRDALRSLLRDDVDFKGLTPGRFWEATSADELVDDILLGAWFEPTDVVDEVLSVDADTVAARRHLSYRFRVSNPRGQHLVEQQAYLELDGDRIGWLRVMCAGFQPVD